MNCVNLRSVTIADGYIIGNDILADGSEGWDCSIGEYAFYGCTSLEEVDIPVGIRSIHARAFYNCESLKSVHFPYSIDGIYGEAFMNCTSLESVTFDEILKDLEALWEKYDWQYNGLYIIETRAFMNCTSIKSLDLPMGCWICCMCQSMFEGCTGLESISIPSSWDYNATYFYGSILKNCTGIKELHLTDVSGNCNVNASELYKDGDWWMYDAEEYSTEYSSFYGWTEEQTVIFDTQGYEELISYCFFDAEYYDCVLFAHCEAKVYDCDGNRIIYDTETGNLIKVVTYEENAEGELVEVVVYDPNAEE